MTTNFDIIIDLNINYDSKVENFILMQDSNFKIGFKHDKSDLLYNVQLDISKSQIAENGYQKILEFDMKNIIIYEDSNFEKLAPFSINHASFELKCGIFSNLERIIKYFNNSNIL